MHEGYWELLDEAFKGSTFKLEKLAYVKTV
jgi:hypothetical protein